MLRTALIHHYPFIPNQFEPYYDWLVELEPELNPNNRTIMTWRLLKRIDFLEKGKQYSAKLIQPHRAYYLELNETKQLSQLRGFVQPVMKGTVNILTKETWKINKMIRWSNKEQVLIINLTENIIECKSLTS
jgi:hypothetical protein